MRKKTLVKKLLPIFNSLRTTHTTCCFIFSIAFYIHGWRLNALILVRNPIKHIFLPLKPCLSTKYIFQVVCTLYTKGTKSLNFEYNTPLIFQKIAETILTKNPLEKTFWDFKKWIKYTNHGSNGARRVHENIESVCLLMIECIPMYNC